MTASQIFGRLFQALLTLLAVSFLVYVLIGLMPGDPVDLMAMGNPHITPEDIARLRAIYGLDQPLPTRYAHWLLSALSGDLGYSRLYNLPVLQVIGPRALHTAVLMGAALLVTVAVALPLGVHAARYPGGKGDRAINALCLAGISVPTFWLALLLICFFSVLLGWLPASATITDGTIAFRLKSLILPILAITAGDAAAYIRHTRTAMLEALKADHIRTARAKGCPERRVVWGHALKNALPPIVTIFMLDLGTLIGGAITIEMIFGYPGMGKLMMEAVNGNDYNLALSEFLILTVFVLTANFIADALYTVLDPRINQSVKR